MIDQLPLWLVAASLSLNAMFLHRLLHKLEQVHVWIVGTPDQPGLKDRVATLERQVGLSDQHDADAPLDGIERRHTERRRRRFPHTDKRDPS